MTSRPPITTGDVIASPLRGYASCASTAVTTIPAYECNYSARGACDVGCSCEKSRYEQSRVAKRNSNSARRESYSRERRAVPAARSRGERAIIYIHIYVLRVCQLIGDCRKHGDNVSARVTPLHKRRVETEGAMGFAKSRSDGAGRGYASSTTMFTCKSACHHVTAWCASLV